MVNLLRITTKYFERIQYQIRDTVRKNTACVKLAIIFLTYEIYCVVLGLFYIIQKFHKGTIAERIGKMFFGQPRPFFDFTVFKLFPVVPVDLNTASNCSLLSSLIHEDMEQNKSPPSPLCSLLLF